LGATNATNKSSGTQELPSAPLNLRLPRAHLGATMDERRIVGDGSTKKSASQAFSDAVERAGRSDCRSAYAQAGLLAIPHLLADAISDRGCKW
jgi:hypothetical protein